MSIAIAAIDHFVLTVADIPRTVEFYTRVLGMKAEIFGPLARTALHFGGQKINLHQVDRTFDPKAARPTPGSADFCLIAETPVEAVAAHLRTSGVAIVEGPVARTGARGTLLSVYFRDPDSNLVEISNYRA